jgi:DNA polymerase-3 subunit alpha
MLVCQTVIESVAGQRRRNVEGQMDMFGLSSDAGAPAAGGIELPDVPEYPKGDLMLMEREVTGLYLSGHPMDEFRGAAKRAGAVGLGEILADFAREGGNIKFADDQRILVAGVIESVKTKPTRNDSMMAYLSLNDGTGGIELLAFQRVIDESGGYMQANAPVIAHGRLSARDEKDPQIVLDGLRPITDLALLASGQLPAVGGQEPVAAKNLSPAKDLGTAKKNPAPQQEKTLYVKLRSEDSPEYERLKLVHIMFPGRERMVIHFSDTKKNVGAKCIIHDALLGDLREMLGEENVVVK